MSVGEAVSNRKFQGIGMTSQRTRERLVAQLAGRGIKNLRVLDVIRQTPRHIFLEEALAHRAYEDTSLPIGYNQTISQPYIVARMTELILRNGSGSLKNVLEIGTGSGYQTAVLAQFANLVYTVERIRPLQDKAKQQLQSLGFHNIKFRHANGGYGWSQVGSFDAILSAAAPVEIPQQLISQLAPNGILVIPVGGKERQQLTVVTRIGGTQEFHTEIIEDVLFVPLLGGLEK